MTQIEISNSGGTLECDAVSFEEEQVCDVAIREVPTRSAGSIVDTDTYVIRDREIRMTIRLTTTQKTTLDAIFNASVVVTIIGLVADDYEWSYTAWLKDKSIKYQYSKDSTSTKEWVAKLTFVLATSDSMSYENCPCDRFDGFETGDKADFWIIGDPSHPSLYEIVTDPNYVKHGTYGGKSDDNSASWYHALTGTNTTKWFEWWYKFVPNPDNPPAGASSSDLMHVILTNGALEWDGYIQVVTGVEATPIFRLVDNALNFVDGEGLPVDEWFFVQWKIVSSATQIIQTIYVNNSVYATLTTPVVGYGTFLRLEWDNVLWTFGIDCRTAMDDWCEVDGDDKSRSDLPTVCWR